MQSLITKLATFISTSGGIGFFTFGFLERLLIETILGLVIKLHITKIIPIAGKYNTGATIALGIIIGVVVGLLHNKYCDKDLGEVLSVYGGKS